MASRKTAKTAARRPAKSSRKKTSRKPSKKKTSRKKAAKRTTRKTTRKKATKKRAATSKAKTRKATTKKAAGGAAKTTRAKTPARRRKNAAQRSATAGGVDLVAIRRVALALPSVEEGTSYGTPAFRVKSKLFLRLHQNGDDLVVRLDDDLCEMLMQAEDDLFHQTPHYEGHPYVLARLAALDESRLAALIEEAWDLAAPPTLRQARAWPDASRARRWESTRRIISKGTP